MNNYFVKYYSLVLSVLLYCFSIGCSTASVFFNREDGLNNSNNLDALEIIYRIAEEKGMRVIVDLNNHGGELYHNRTAEEVSNTYREYIKTIYGRYGNYKSFWGWYINNELNPLKLDEVPISTFWRTIWRSAVQECKQVAPHSMVTISPFFLLDVEGYRGFEYLDPLVYEKWWSKTLSETGIDILMVQDSGAEHLGFFTLGQREAFFKAFKNACVQSGSKLWLNVETGEVDAKNWDEAIKMEKGNNQKWVYTATKWLAEKLNLASFYGEEIISWGYYPFMNPNASDGPFLTNDITAKMAKKNYSSYKKYYEKEVKLPKKDGALTKPLINGSLWWMPVNYQGWTKSRLENVIREQIEKQVAVGFSVLWLVNAPAHLDYALNLEK